MTRAPPTRAELLAALEDHNPDNPLAVAIGAVIASYANELNQQTSRAGAIPYPVILPMPQTELEAFALELFSEEIRSMGIHITLKTDKPQ